MIRLYVLYWWLLFMSCRFSGGRGCPDPSDHLWITEIKRWNHRVFIGVTGRNSGSQSTVHLPKQPAWCDLALWRTAAADSLMLLSKQTASQRKSCVWHTFLCFRISRTSSEKASSIFILFFADVSKNRHPKTFANSWPSGRWRVSISPWASIDIFYRSYWLDNQVRHHTWSPLEP